MKLCHGCKRDKQDKEQLDALVNLAHEWGWNGVENSKILSTFYRNLLEDLRSRLLLLDAQKTKVEKEAMDLWSKNQNPNHIMGQ